MSVNVAPAAGVIKAAVIFRSGRKDVPLEALVQPDSDIGEDVEDELVWNRDLHGRPDTEIAREIGEGDQQRAAALGAGQGDCEQGMGHARR